MAETHENNNAAKKRKKKRSSIQMAKKFARQRYSGTDLDSETYQYMLRILELMREGFPSAEEKLIFVTNVYEQTVGRELEFARNQVGSRILDSLLNFANLDVIQRLVTAFNSSLRPLSTDKFASHVLQKIIIVCADRGNKQSNVETKTEKSNAELIEVKESDMKLYNDITLKLSKYLINNIEEFIWDTYANHLLRTVVECLGGLIHVSNDQSKKKPLLSDIVRRPVIEEYTKLLLESSDRLLKWPQFLEFGKDELTSGLLQSILHSLKDVDSKLQNSYIKKITKECFKSGEDQILSDIFDKECSIRLLEACLPLAKKSSYSRICTRFFTGNLQRLSLMQGANFSVQRLLDNCSTKEDLEPIFEEMSPHFKIILEKGHTGILTSIANACMRLQVQQGAFVKALTQMLECDDKQLLIVPCTVTLKMSKVVEEAKKSDNWKISVELHGSLIVQAMLRFNKPIKIINSLLEMKNEELLQLFGNPKGSRIVDAFMDSKYIGEKSREKLARKLKGCWPQLAQSTHGSRCLETIWQWSQPKQRHIIMEELAAVGESLRSTMPGQIIMSKLNVSLFARNKKDWSESFGKEEKTRALFANIISKTPDK